MPNNGHTPTWLRPSEAATHLRVSQTFLAKLRCYGGGPRYQKISKNVLYDRAELDLWAGSMGRISTSDDGAEMKKPTT
jgi:hypothetical protein